MLKINGIYRTNEDFLNGVQKIFEGRGVGEVIHKLRRLGIFSSITETKDGLSVTEEKRSISFSGDTTRGIPRGYLKMKLPNLFGRAENMELSLSTSRDMSFKVTKPIVCGSLSFLSIHGIRDVMKSPDDEYSHMRGGVEMEQENSKICIGRERIGYLNQMFVEFRRCCSVFDIKSKIGMLDFRMSRIFMKMQLGMTLNRMFSGNLFNTLSLSTGMILGEPHVTERYHLGENIKGYREMSISPRNSGMRSGGRSFIESTYKMGMCIGDSKAFVFSSVGYVSEDRNVFNSLHEMIQSRMYKGDECLGASVGLGANVPIMRSKDGPMVGVSFSIPLTNNDRIQKLQFGFDMDF